MRQCHLSCRYVKNFCEKNIDNILCICRSIEVADCNLGHNWVLSSGLELLLGRSVGGDAEKNRPSSWLGLNSGPGNWDVNGRPPLRRNGRIQIEIQPWVCLESRAREHTEARHQAKRLMHKRGTVACDECLKCSLRSSQTGTGFSKCWGLLWIKASFHSFFFCFSIMDVYWICCKRIHTRDRAFAVSCEQKLRHGCSHRDAFLTVRSEILKKVEMLN